MKIYETRIPIEWPFRFAIVGNKLINVEERPVSKTTEWWNKSKGYHRLYNYIMVDGRRTIVSDDSCIIGPSFNVPKDEYDDFIYTENLNGFIESAEKLADAIDISIEEINVNIAKKDYIDHWEVAVYVRREVIQHGTLLTDLPTMFR
jgi:hypothetical protein